MVVAKLVKLIPLFLRDPTYLIMAPVSILFGQFHALIKLYAASTLHVVSVEARLALACECTRTKVHFLQTAWGSREGADENDAYRMIQIKQADCRSTLPTCKNEIYI